MEHFLDLGFLAGFGLLIFEEFKVSVVTFFRCAVVCELFLDPLRFLLNLIFLRSHSALKSDLEPLTDVSLLDFLVVRGGKRIIDLISVKEALHGNIFLVLDILAWNRVSMW